MSSHQEWLDSLEVGKNPCKKCRSKGRDRSGDNFHFYGKGQGGYCNACGYTIPSDDVIKENSKYNDTRKKKSKPKFEECEIKVMAKEFNEDDWAELLEVSAYDPSGYRGLKESTCEHYQVVHTYSEKTGEIESQRYPCTEDSELVGCKTKKFPKKFFFQGKTGNQIDLFGQWLYTNSNSKWVVITGGELDALSGHQILEDNRKKGFETIPVVSPTNGETGSDKQLKNHYEWLNKFEKIFLCLDNDAAGIEATEKAVKVLPKGKVYIIKMARKDVNEYIWDNEKGKPLNHSQEWYNAFWRAEKYVPAGVLGSNTLYDVILDKANVDRISLPKFAKKLQDMMSGGIPLKSIVNISAASGIGKTVYVNEFVLHWIFNTPFKVGVCSLEADVAEYGENLLSRYSGKKISLFNNKEDKIEYLKKEEVREKALELFQDSEGLPRFYINDDRGDFDSLTSKIEQMVISCGVQILVIDPTSDALAGLSNEEVDLFMQWQKKLTKSHDVTIINIMHSRKGSADKKAGSEGAVLTEESIIGASSQYKSASANILLSRNKMEEDEFLRNITSLGLPKCRWTGNTGPAGKVFYENATHTCHDLDSYIENHPEFKDKLTESKVKKEEVHSPKKFKMEKK